MARLLDFPRELLVIIGLYLDRARDRAALAATCRPFHQIFNSLLYKFNIENQNSDAVIWAATRGRLETLELLADFGASFDAPDPHHFPYWRGGAPRTNWRSVVALNSSELPRGYLTNASSALHMAAATSHYQIVEFLLRRGADKDSLSPLLCDCNTRMSSPENTDWHSRPPSARWRTPLHRALCSGHGLTAAILAQSGAMCYRDDLVDPTHADKSAEQVEQMQTATRRINQIMTAIVDTLQGGSREDINARDECGRTLLHHACTYIDSSFVSRELILLGADPCILDDNGWTPFRDCVLRMGHFRSALGFVEARALDAIHDSLLDACIHSLLTVPLDRVLRLYNDRTRLLEALLEPPYVSRPLFASSEKDNGTRGLTPLHLSTRRVVDIRLMEIILMQGGDTDALDDKGHTPLWTLLLEESATEGRNLDWQKKTKLLLKYCAQLAVKNPQSGKTILEDDRWTTRRWDMQRLKFLLENAGARNVERKELLRVAKAWKISGQFKKVKLMVQSTGLARI